MPNYTKTLLLCLLTLIGFTEAKATHVMGADITYTCDSAYAYTFKVVYYRDCRGVAFSNPSSATRVRCASGGQVSVALTLESIEEVTPLCASGTSKCNPANTFGTGAGIEKHTYIAKIDFEKSPFSGLKSCNRVIFETGQCCRNGAINTGPSGNFYTYAELDLTKAAYNNSPKFTLSPFALLCCNQPYYGGMGGQDHFDTDSLVYKMSNPLSGWNQNISYSGSHSYLKPFTVYYPGSLSYPYTNPNASPPIGFFINSETGDIVFTPTKCDEVTVAVFEIEEWRKDSTGTYNKIGVTRRDMQFIVNSCPDNNPPIIKGPYTKEFEVQTCSGLTCFDIETDDKVFVPPPPATAPAPDTVTFEIPELPEGFSFELLDKDSLHQKGRICFDPSVVKPSSLPYAISVRVRDNQCPLNASTTRTFKVTVSISDSSGLVQGILWNDTNQNCIQDAAEDTFSIIRQLKHGKNPSQYSSSDNNGVFKFCAGVDSNTMSLVPSPWFEDKCTDTTIIVEHDSTYYPVFYSKLKNGIAGYVLLDKDSNCIDDPVLQGVEGVSVTAEPGNHLVKTDKNGFYLLDIPAGTYTLKMSYDSNAFTNKCLDSIKVTLPSSSHIFVDSFRLYPRDLYDLKVTAGASTGATAVVGRNTNYVVSVKNKTKEHVDSVYLYLRIPANDVTALYNSGQSSSGWDSLGGGLFRMKLTNLTPFSHNFYRLSCIFSTSAKVNTNLCYSTWLDSSFLVYDNTDVDNIDDFCQRVRRSYDPNSKTTVEDSIFTVTDRRLNYIVQFQNTGNYQATTVTLKDTLPKAFDLNTLEIGTASHPFSYFLQDGVLWVTFENINLPDSLSEPEASNGFFMFSIALREEINEDTTLSNRVGIYFDYEEPVMTNYAINTFKSPIEIELDTIEPLCSFDELIVPFKTNYQAKTGNYFILELSSKDGDFSAPTILDSLQSHQLQDSFSWIVSDAIPSGTNYQLRIRASSPQTISFEDYYSPVFEIHQLPEIKLNVSSTQLCYGESIEVIGSNAYDSSFLFVDLLLTASSDLMIFSVDSIKDGQMLFLEQRIGNCSRMSDSLNFEVFAVPMLELDDTVFCEGVSQVPLNYSVTLSHGKGQLDSLFWDFGDGTVLRQDASESAPVHSYANGLYTLSLITSSSGLCADTLSSQIEVGNKPTAEIGIVKDSFCSNESIEAHAVQGEAIDGDLFTWDMGDNTLLTTDSISHLYSATGSYVLGLVQENKFGCKDTSELAIEISPVAIATMDAIQDQCVNNEIVFNSTSSGNVQAVHWTIDQVDYSSNPIQLNFNTDGQHDYSLIAINSNGCNDTLNGSFNLFAIDTVNYSLTTDYCQFDSISLDFAPKLLGTNVEWRINGNVQSNGDWFVLQQSGVQNVMLKTVTSNACSDSISWQLNVVNNALADLSLEDHCFGQSTLILNMSTDYQPSTNFILELGDGNVLGPVAYQTQWTHTYASPGIYDVRIIAETGICSDTNTASIAVFPTPNAGFEVNKGASVWSKKLTSTSTNGVSHFWMVDGQLVNNQDTEFDHNFGDRGEFNIKLVVENTEGCRDSISQMVLIIGEVKFYVPNSFSPNNDGINDEYNIYPTDLIDQMTFTVYNRWGGRVSVSNDPNQPIKEELSSGLYLYTLSLTDVYGNQHEFSGSIVVLE